jgi:hypothetical protein
MTDLSKTAASQEHRSSISVSEMIAAAAVVLLLIAVQGMFIGKPPHAQRSCRSCTLRHHRALAQMASEEKRRSQ